MINNSQKEKFLAYFHSLSGISPEHTDVELVSLLFESYNWTHKSTKKKFEYKHRRYSGTTTIIEAFLDYVDDPNIVYSSYYGHHKRTVPWVSLNETKASLIILDNPLTKDQERSEVLSNRFKEILESLQCPFLLITGY
jgi:hypothetical protein